MNDSGVWDVTKWEAGVEENKEDRSGTGTRRRCVMQRMLRWTLVATCCKYGKTPGKRKSDKTRGSGRGQLTFLGKGVQGGRDPAGFCLTPKCRREMVELVQIAQEKGA